MKDEGLVRAIEAAGGVGSPARGLGISQPSVSGWTRIPADRVVAVEALTKIPLPLDPADLFAGDKVDEDSSRKAEIDEIDQLRAAEWGMLAVLLGRARPRPKALRQVGAIKGDATELGMAHLALGEAATATDGSPRGARVFRPLHRSGRGEFLPYASYYLTGFRNERARWRACADLERLGVERDGPRSEPEDHIAILCDDGPFRLGLVGSRPTSRRRRISSKRTSSRGRSASSRTSRFRSARNLQERCRASAARSWELEARSAFMLPS